MLTDFAWISFERTGNIEYYLCFKEIQKNCGAGMETAGSYNGQAGITGTGVNESWAAVKG